MGSSRHGRSRWTCTSGFVAANGVLLDSSEWRKDRDDDQINGQDVVHLRDGGGNGSSECCTGAGAKRGLPDITVRNVAGHWKPVHWNAERPATTAVARHARNRIDRGGGGVRCARGRFKDES